MADQNPKLLIVDDKPHNIYAIRRIIEVLDVSIVEAESGEAALRALLNHNFFMILMDVQMPGMSGFEAASLIIDNPQTSNIPIVFVTANSQEEGVALRGYKTGAVDYLAKPVDPIILLAKIRVFRELWSKNIQLQNSLLQLAQSNHEQQQLNHQLLSTSNSLQQANQQLNNEINERKTIEAALRTAQEAADSANKAKSSFLANMSHEIRTPLGAITGYLHLVLQTQLTTRQKDYLSKIKLSANNLLSVINDILDFSKIEADKLEIESIPFDLDSVLHNLSDVVAFKAEEKELELVIDCPAEIPRNLIGDPLRLGQILLNLVSNAIKFTSTGEVLVNIEIIENNTEQQNDSVTLRYSVIDTGIGMDSKQLQKLFRPFSQADSSTTRQYGGTGLGLVICQKLLALMGSAMHVTSTVDVGTTFSFELTNELGRSAPIVNFDKLNACFEAAKVLVVDDNQSSRIVLVNMLRSYGIEAVSLDNGMAAIKELKQALTTQAYDLVLVDWKMPEMDGIETIAQMQNALATADLPKFILMSAYQFEESELKSQPINVDNILTKPISSSELLDTLQQTYAATNFIPKVTPKLIQERTPSAPQLAGKSILLVEDDNLNQEIALKLLAPSQATVILANNGQEAVNLVTDRRSNNGKPFDLVLMDCQMPVMDGYQATKEIRQHTEHQHLPIVAMTANAMSCDKDACLAAGMNDHLAKPIDVKQLYKRLAQWLLDANKLSQHNPQKKYHTDLPADEQELLNIPGINTEEGIRLLGGQVRFYKKMLFRFIEQHHDVVDKIRNELQKENWDDARRLTHNLKSISGSLGADSLHRITTSLEQQIVRQDITNIEQELMPLTECITPIFTHLNRYVEKASA